MNLFIDKAYNIPNLSNKIVRPFWAIATSLELLEGIALYNEAFKKTKADIDL